MKIVALFLLQLGILFVVAMGVIAFHWDAMGQWNEPFRTFCIGTSGTGTALSLFASFFCYLDSSINGS